MKQPYNKFSDEEYKQVPKENKEISEDFLLSLKGEKTPQTIRVYTNNCKIILIIMYRLFGDKKIVELVKKDLIKMRVYMLEQLKLSTARVNIIYSTLRMMMLFAEEDPEYSEGLENQFISCGSKVKGLPKQPVRDESMFFMSYDLITQIKDKLLEENNIQGALIHMMLYESACRRNELVQIQKDGLLKGNWTNEVVGKGRKKFKLSYQNDIKPLISQWLENRDDDCPYLFVKIRNGQTEPMTAEDIYSFVSTKIRNLATEIEGKDNGYTCHSYRHSRLNNLLHGTDLSYVDKKGNPKKMDINDLRLLANHNDISTTSGYVQTSTTEVLNELFGFDEDEND